MTMGTGLWHSRRGHAQAAALTYNSNNQKSSTHHTACHAETMKPLTFHWAHSLLLLRHRNTATDCAASPPTRTGDNQMLSHWTIITVLLQSQWEHCLTPMGEQNKPLTSVHREIIQLYKVIQHYIIISLSSEINKQNHSFNWSCDKEPGKTWITSFSCWITTIMNLLHHPPVSPY